MARAPVRRQALHVIDQSVGSLPEPHALRGWRSIVFAPVGDGQRRRRGSDGARLAAAILALLCCVLVIRYNSRIDRAIVEVIHPPPRSITWLVTVVYDAGAFGVTLLLLALALIARRWEVARDIAASAVVAAAVSGLLTLALGSNGGRPGGIVIGGYYMRFPVLQIALFMAVTGAALPYLARGVQRLIEVFVALVALASAVGGHGLPLNVLGSLAIGWGATALVRLIFGSPLGLPSLEDVRALLEELGIRTTEVRAAPRQVWGVAKYQGTQVRESDPAGRPIGISVYGRDAADAKLLTKAGRFLFYRDSGPSLTLTRLQQVEHEAYLTLRAGQAGVAVPEILETGTAGPSRDAVLVYRLPPGTPLSEADTAGITDVTRYRPAAPDADPPPGPHRPRRDQRRRAAGRPVRRDHRGPGFPQRHLERFPVPARPRPGRCHRGDGTGRRRRTGGRRRGRVPGSRRPCKGRSSIFTRPRSTRLSAGLCAASASFWRRSGSAPPRPSRSRCRNWSSPAG